MTRSIRRFPRTVGSVTLIHSASSVRRSNAASRSRAARASRNPVTTSAPAGRAAVSVALTVGTVSLRGGLAEAVPYIHSDARPRRPRPGEDLPDWGRGVARRLARDRDGRFLWA